MSAGRGRSMICPVCSTVHDRGHDSCPVCGANLHFLKKHPRRVAYAVQASVAFGLGLFFALAWQIFAPLLGGMPPAEPGPWFWWGFALGTFFLAFGLTARRHLALVLSRLFRLPDA